MNRIFGFFKQKLIEAKEQNQSQLQSLLSAIDFEAYSETRMLNLLQQVKTNYLEWNIMIANEASTGLYYTQIHNKTALGKHIRGRRESQDKQERLAIVLQQMRKTLKELQAIEKLNYQWTNTMSERVLILGSRDNEKTEANTQELAQQGTLQQKQQTKGQIEVPLKEGEQSGPSLEQPIPPVEADPSPPQENVPPSQEQAKQSE